MQIRSKEILISGQNGKICRIMQTAGCGGCSAEHFSYLYPVGYYSDADDYMTLIDNVLINKQFKQC